MVTFLFNHISTADKARYYLKSDFFFLYFIYVILLNPREPSRISKILFRIILKVSVFFFNILYSFSIRFITTYYNIIIPMTIIYLRYITVIRNNDDISLNLTYAGIILFDAVQTTLILVVIKLLYYHYYYIIFYLIKRKRCC